MPETPTAAPRRQRQGLLTRLWPKAAAAVPEVAQTLFYEVIPSAQLTLPNIKQARFADREALTHDVASELVPAILRLVDLAGNDPAKVRTRVGPGGYHLETSPSIQTQVVLADADANRAAAALGWVFRQESVIVADLQDRVEGRTGWVIVDFPEGAVTPELAHAFFQHAASMSRGLGEGYTAFVEDLLFFNMRDDDGAPVSGLEDAAFIEAMRTVAAAFSGAKVTAELNGVADARFVWNDWRAERDPDGQGYGRQLGPELTASLAPVRERHSAMVRAAAQRYGW